MCIRRAHHKDYGYWKRGPTCSRQPAVNLLKAGMVNHIEKICRPLAKDQRQQLAVSMDDFIFDLPEDVSAVFEQCARADKRSLSDWTVTTVWHRKQFRVNGLVIE
ncbi:hypothetical protein PAMP_002671 [Pampus punctatissimus]